MIVYKLVAARPRDLGDVESIVQAQRTRLDFGLIRRWLVVFAELKEDPDIGRFFEDAVKKWCSA